MTIRFGVRFLKVSEHYEKIICPKCNGNGKIQHSNRVNWDEYEYWEEKCNYCNGRRIVMRKTVVEDLEVEELKIDENKHVC